MMYVHMYMFRPAAIRLFWLGFLPTGRSNTVAEFFGGSSRRQFRNKSGVPACPSELSHRPLARNGFSVSGPMTTTIVVMYDL